MKSRKNEEQLKKIIKYIEEKPNDKGIIKLNVVRYPQILEYVDQEIFEDKDFCVKILSINGMLLEYMPDKIKSNKELVIIALKNSGGFALSFADKKIRTDIEVVKHAIIKYKYPLLYASEELQFYFKQKWDKYYSKHNERSWNGYNISFNGINTSKEEMNKIYNNETKPKKSKKYREKIRKNQEYEAIKDFLEEQQIKFNEYNFEEKD